MEGRERMAKLPPPWYRGTLIPTPAPDPPMRLSRMTACLPWLQPGQPPTVAPVRSPMGQMLSPALWGKP